MAISGKRILLIMAGGIAAYKALEVIRRAREKGASVHVILTAAAAEFVTPLTVSALTGERTHMALFDLTEEAEMGHIELSRDADILVVAPATADLIGKMAAGLANDLASTALLATDKPVLIAPAMNVRMWNHPATQRNVATLLGDGVAIVGPAEGAMACGEFGFGRMVEPEEILAAIEAVVEEKHGADAGPAGGRTGAQALAGRHVLVTSGPTHEPIDPVRFIGNRSSGRQGHAIAAAAAAAGARVTLVSGPVALADPAGVRVVHVETAVQMLDACLAALPADVAICAAAVADWRVVDAAPEKIKKDAAGTLPSLTFAENPDILRTIAQQEELRPQLVVGFAAETENVVAHAREKRLRKGCEWIVANDVSPETGIMGGAENAVHLVTAETVEDWPRLTKREVAVWLVERIASWLQEADADAAG